MAHKCIGFAQETDLSTAKNLPSIPSGCDYAVITPEGGNVRWRADGSDPTNDVGMFLASTATFTLQGPFSTVKFIEDTVSDSPSISVSYFSYG